MTTVRDILGFFERIAPLSLCEPYDNSGLVAGDPDAPVGCALLALDATPDAVREAVQAGAQAVITHHPPYLAPVKTVVSGAPDAGTVFEAIRAGVALICMHTNMDAARPGVSDALCRALGLEPEQPLEPRGQDGQGFGRMAALTSEHTPAQLAAHVRAALGCNGVTLVDCGRPVRRVCVMGGSGGDFLLAARSAGADAIVTGELKHSGLLTARALGLSAVAAGHFESEWPVVPLMAGLLGEAFPRLGTRLWRQSPASFI